VPREVEVLIKCRIVEPNVHLRSEMISEPSRNTSKNVFRYSLSLRELSSRTEVDETAGEI